MQKNTYQCQKIVVLLFQLSCKNYVITLAKVKIEFLRSTQQLF